MAALSSKPITQLLYEWRNGSSEALDQLMPLVYDELRALARHYLRSEPPFQTLQATALVNSVVCIMAGATTSVQRYFVGRPWR